MTAKKDATKRFLVTVVGSDHWNPEVRGWLERPAGTTADQAIVMPTFQGRRGHPVLFAASLFDELRAAPPIQGARYVVHQHAADILVVPTEEEGIVLNTNDPAAFEKVLQMSRPE